MEHYILASHGALAYGMKTAIEMICGKSEQLESYDLEHYGSPEEIYHIIEQKVQQNTGDTYVVFTDLLGGSVQNRLLSLGRYENTVIISGMHLGLVIAMMTEQKPGTLQERADAAIQATLPLITAFTKEKIHKSIEEGGGDEI